MQSLITIKEYLRGLFLILLLISPLNAGASIIIVGDLTHERTVSPGETHRGVIVLQNIGDRLRDVQIYQTDYTYSADGQSHYSQTAGDLPRSNAGWIYFSPRHLSIPPGEKMEVNYRIQVPPGDTLSGTYWSMIMIEPLAADYVEQMQRGAVGVKTVVRYAVQLITHMENEGTVDLVIKNVEVVLENGKRMFHADFINTGQQLVRPKTWIELFNENGDSIGTFNGRVQRIFPDTSVRQSIDITRVKPGNYKVLLIADCGGDHLFGVQYTIQLEK